MKKAYPREISNGNSTVKIYRVAHSRTASGFLYRLTWYDGPVRREKNFADEDSAVTEARVKVGQLAKGLVGGAQMSQEDRATLQAARDIAGKVPLVAALQEWAKVREITQGQAIAAAEAWALRNVAQHERLTVSEVVDLFLAAKTKDKIATVKNHNHIFVDMKSAFGAMRLDEVSVIQIGAWLGKWEHPGTFNTFRKHTVALWRWAQRQNYLPRNLKTEAEQIQARREPPKEIGIITAEIFGDLLGHFQKKHPEYVPALALAGFCGLRRSEVHAQTWADVKLDRGFVWVTKAKEGTPSRRLVPLCPAAVAWLELTKDRTDFICGNLAIDRIRNIAKDATDKDGMPLFGELPDNCFRHSFISHRIAATGNVAETALEAGNSPDVIFKHYRRVVEKPEGLRWFEIKPPAKS